MCQLGNSSREIMGGLQHLANPGTLIQRHCHAHYGPAWLTAGSRGRSRHWPVRMSRRGDCPLVELEYMVLSSVKHTPTFDVTANSRRESLLATSALNPVTVTLPLGSRLSMYAAGKSFDKRKLSQVRSHLLQQQETGDHWNVGFRGTLPPSILPTSLTNPGYLYR